MTADGRGSKRDLARAGSPTTQPAHAAVAVLAVGPPSPLSNETAHARTIEAGTRPKRTKPTPASNHSFGDNPPTVSTASAAQPRQPSPGASPSTSSPTSDCASASAADSVTADPSPPLPASQSSPSPRPSTPSRRWLRSQRFALPHRATKWPDIATTVRPSARSTDAAACQVVWTSSTLLRIPVPMSSVAAGGQHSA